ncbi:hypothetical protein Tco_0836037 [Tanacetum coccineum]
MNSGCSSRLPKIGGLLIVGDGEFKVKVHQNFIDDLDFSLRRNVATNAIFFFRWTSARVVLHVKFVVGGIGMAGFVLFSIGCLVSYLSELSFPSQSILEGVFLMLLVADLEGLTNQLVFGQLRL